MFQACLLIGAFATSEIVFVKELGVGTALAVLIDATIIRALLVGDKTEGYYSSASASIRSSFKRSTRPMVRAI